MEKRVNEILKAENSKSKKMVELYNEGLDISEIAKIMGVRYNFSYNVISNYCRMNDVDLRVVKKENKKERIIELIDAGKTNVEISKEVKSCYNYVFNVRKEYERADAK
jgi:predicted transcriptional regulator